MKKNTKHTPAIVGAAGGGPEMSTPIRVTLTRVYSGIEVKTDDGRVWYTQQSAIGEREIRRAYPGQFGDLERIGDTAEIIDYQGIFNRTKRTAPAGRVGGRRG